MKDMFRLDDKVAVVVGGAGGIGEACSRALSDHGATVVLASRNLEKLEEVACDINSDTCNETGFFQVDTSDEASVNNLVDLVHSKYGKVDILVNTQGMNIKGLITDFPVEDWDRIFNVNVKGVMLCCKAFGKKMMEVKSGKIINMSSVRGIRGTGGGNTAYGATKGAVDMITRMLAAEFAPYGINVNAMAPSLVLTETIKNAVAPERLEMLASSSLFKRLGTPEEMAGACVFLASRAADFITGQIIYIDGGLTAVG
ncbi:SDR family NAD(P)-dependent oxidoreductase [Thermodesulfobacteriota bacterium]